MDELFGVTNFDGIEDIGRAGLKGFNDEEQGHVEVVEKTA